MDNLAIFFSKISDVENCSHGELILYFSYYLHEDNLLKTIQASDIKECYDNLKIKPYSNISSYLSQNSKGKDADFIKKEKGYVLTRNAIGRIKKKLDIPIDSPVSNNLLPIEIFDGCPFYIVSNAKQMIRCYDAGLYDATLVMMRKLIETIIIECFEKYNIENQIKDAVGKFYYLSDLIPLYINNNSWNISRNMERNIQLVKKYGDLSAHNRRFIAKKSDLNELKFELRQTIQEMILIINYN